MKYNSFFKIFLLQLNHISFLFDFSFLPLTFLRETELKKSLCATISRIKLINCPISGI